MHENYPVIMAMTARVGLVVTELAVLLRNCGTKIDIVTICRPQRDDTHPGYQLHIAQAIGVYHQQRRLSRHSDRMSHSDHTRWSIEATDTHLTWAKSWTRQWLMFSKGQPPHSEAPGGVRHRMR